MAPPAVAAAGAVDPGTPTVAPHPSRALEAAGGLAEDADRQAAAQALDAAHLLLILSTRRLRAVAGQPEGEAPWHQVQALAIACVVQLEASAEAACGPLDALAEAAWAGSNPREPVSASAPVAPWREPAPVDGAHATAGWRHAAKPPPAVATAGPRRAKPPGDDSRAGAARDGRDDAAPGASSLSRSCAWQPMPCRRARRCRGPARR